MPIRRLLQTLRTEGDHEQAIERLLGVAREYLGMDIAYVSEWRDGQQIFERLDGDAPSFGVARGDAMDLHGSFCIRVMSGRIGNIVSDVAAEPEVRDLDAAKAVGVGSYIGVPVRLSDGHQYGMLCCLSHEPSPNLAERDVRFLEMIAAMVAERLDATALERRVQDEIASRTRRAIEAGGLDIHYQPIVRIADRAIVGFEALARFPDAAERSPAAWFDEAWTVDLGPDLELAAIAAALAPIDRIGAEQYLSLNVSPATLFDDRFAPLIGPFARRLVFEITEHAEVEDYQELVAAATSVRALGARMAVDDAGAGYSTFRHILQLEPDIIKADLTLVRDVDTDPARRALVRALVAFATETGAILVGEGIETESESQTMAVLGARFGQGYLYGRPAPLHQTGGGRRRTGVAGRSSQTATATSRLPTHPVIAR